MTLTVLGDFADPLSLLASQRLARLQPAWQARGDRLVWLAVEADRRRPVGGSPLAAAEAEHLAALSLPGERLPAAGALVPNSAAATAAYAESLTDGCEDALRTALFESAWVDGGRIADPNVIRDIVYRVRNPRSLGDVRVRIQENLPVIPFGAPDPIARSRQLGFIVSMAGGPLTSLGQQRVDTWRRRWQEFGPGSLPILITDTHQVFRGREALDWLAGRLTAGTGVPSKDDLVAAA